MFAAHALRAGATPRRNHTIMASAILGEAVDPERYARLSEIFAEAADAPAEHRAELIRRRCGDDVELLAEIERMLVADADTEAVRLFDDTPTVRDTSDAELPREMPERIASYTLRRCIGEGGMGRVYEAEQPSPRRTVALKVLRPGLTSESELRRFELEAELLGRLEHPGIARIYESGAAETDAGPQPFFAMELVDGVSVTEYADAHDLDDGQRLGLVALICDAVEHAHQRGVIHRDLKPPNILVDERGQPRILDFGVGRAIDAEIGHSLHTRAGELMGTVAYMSPEQAAGDPAEVDTRTDVYSLGVIAFQLLTGEMPLPLGDTSLLSALEKIRDEKRQPLAKVKPDLDPDVCTIINKAIATERSQRYASAGALATDIRRYQQSEPILARPPSAVYQLTLFARRNRNLFRGSFIAAVALVGSVVIISKHAVRLARSESATTRALAAEREARQMAQRESLLHRAVSDFTSTMLGTSGDLSGSKEITVREWLDHAASRIADRLSDQPEVEAHIHDLVARIYSSISDYHKALEHYELASDVREELGPDAHEDAARTLIEIAWINQRLGRYDLSLEQITRALEDLTHRLPAWHSTLVRARLNLSDTLFALERYDEALGELEKALSQQRRRLASLGGTIGEAHHFEQLSLADLLGAVGRLATKLGDLERADQCYSEALSVTRATCEPGDPRIGGALNNRANALMAQGRMDEAEQLLNQALAIYRDSLSEDHSAVGTTYANLATVAFERGDYPVAEKRWRRAVKIRTRVYGPAHPDSVFMNERRVDAFVALDRLDDARAVIDEYLATLRATPDSDPLAEAYAYKWLAEVEVLKKETAAAETATRRRVELVRDDPRAVAELHDALRVLSWLIEERGRFDEALPLRREALTIAEEIFPSDKWIIDYDRQFLARSLIEVDRPEDAVSLLRVSFDLHRERPTPDSSKMRSVGETLARTLRDLGRDAAAREVERQLEDGGS